jgi:hypothetical protein
VACRAGAEKPVTSRDVQVQVLVYEAAEAISSQPSDGRAGACGSGADGRALMQRSVRAVRVVVLDELGPAQAEWRRPVIRRWSGSCSVCLSRVQNLRSNSFPGLPIHPTRHDRTRMHVQSDTRTIPDHWGTPTSVPLPARTHSCVATHVLVWRGPSPDLHTCSATARC